MAELKTKPTTESVTAFLNKIPEEGKRRDAFAVAAMMGEITKEKPRMWGASIVGYGTYRYRTANGQEADWPVAAFSPRKQNLTLYLMPGFEMRTELMSKLGKHKSGKSCLWLNRLDDIHLPTLKTLIRQSVKDIETLRKRQSIVSSSAFRESGRAGKKAK